MAYQPFYIAMQKDEWDNWDAKEKRDQEYMKELYPQNAKRIQEKVEGECDRLEYQGSMMYDEYPDRYIMRGICDKIYRELENEGLTAVELNDRMEMWSGQRRPEPGGRPPYGPGPGRPGPRPPQGPGPGRPGPRPPQGPGPGRPGGRPPQGPGPVRPPRPPYGGGRPWDCWICEENSLGVESSLSEERNLSAQNSNNWLRDMIEVLLYQEMIYRRNCCRRRRWRQRNY